MTNFFVDASEISMTRTWTGVRADPRQLEASDHAVKDRCIHRERRERQMIEIQTEREREREREGGERGER